jgi:hypothetical protein
MWVGVPDASQNRTDKEQEEERKVVDPLSYFGAGNPVRRESDSKHR